MGAVMTEVVHLLTTTGSICLCVITLVLVWWAWTRLRVSVFFWLVLSRVCSGGAFMTFFVGTPAEQQKNAQAAIEQWKNEPDTDIGEKFLSLVAWETLPSLMEPCLLLLLAAVELASLGSRLHPDQKWPGWLLTAHRFRHGIGLMAFACSLMRPLIWWLALPHPAPTA